MSSDKSGHEGGDEDLGKVGILIDLEESNSDLHNELQSHNNHSLPPHETAGKEYTPEMNTKRDSAGFENEKVILIIPSDVASDNPSPVPTPTSKNNAVNIVPPQLPPNRPPRNPSDPPAPARTSINKVIAVPPPVSPNPPPSDTPEANNTPKTSLTPKPLDENDTVVPKVKSHSLLPMTSKNCSVKPDIIIGEIDKDEATIIYDNLLAIGKRVVDWLDTEFNIKIYPTGHSHNESNPERKLHEAQTFQRQIVSIETEYNRLKQDVKPNNYAAELNATPPQPMYYDPKDEIKPEDILPKVFSINSNEPEKKRNPFHNIHDERPCSSAHEPARPLSPIIPAQYPSLHRDKAITKSCTSCLEGRLKHLELAVKDHEGSFTHVVAELRACLEYCNSFSEDSGHDHVKDRITALFKIVALHKAALEDWKQELQNKSKSRK